MDSERSRLIVLPENPGHTSGYAKGVLADVNRLRPTDRDLVIVFTFDDTSAVPGGLVLPKDKGQTRRRALNMLRRRATAEPLVSELGSLVAGRQFDEIFCGETIFYHPLKHLFPGRRMTVRFHNIFAMARYRQQFRRFPIGRMLQYNLEAFFRLEREIFTDPLVHSVFVTEDEQRYVRLAFPDLKCECWPNALNIRSGEPRPPEAPRAHRLVYFGGMPSHTKPGVDYLVRSVFPKVRRLLPSLELHLFGSGTEGYGPSGEGIYGHGFFNGNGYPSEGLYVVPDLLGIGIKIKVGDLVHDGRPFIVTPFGTDGYRLTESEHLMIADIDAWPERIHAYFSRRDLWCEPFARATAQSPAGAN
jgi:hypothetical protein